MSLMNTLRTALRGVTGNKLRAVLTTLGVVIGVASVIAMLALGNGARAAVEASFRFLGSDQIQISARHHTDDGEPVPVGEILSYEDGLLMADQVELVNRVEMSIWGSGRARHGRAVLDVIILGVTADALLSRASKEQLQPVGWPEGEPLSADAYIGRGRFFVPSEVSAGSAVCALGHQTALDLFLGDDPVGQTVWINRQRCVVIGVLADLEVANSMDRQRGNPNEAFYLPISTAIRMLYEDEPSVSIVAHVNDESRMGEAKAQAAAYLRDRHAIEENAGGEYEDDFEMTTRQDILGAQQESARTFALLLTAMATVSLIVGGIGIMNVMLVSVTERTREIGVRLAIGARKRDIVSQFLCESILISAGGGALGVTVGILSVPLAASFNQGNALLAPGSIPLSLGVAVLTGVVFGLYPALRAAQLDPIEALRYE
jgi:putative ABC transport system permease protein